VNPLCALGLGELAEGLAARRFSSRELVEACLERIAATDPRVGAFLSLRAEAALREADAADAARARGESRGRLHGIPLGIKAVLVHPELESSCGSRILAGFRAPYRASALERLERAGAILLGTTNMDEFAMGSSCENSALQRTANPWDLTRIPGGSSGGSAAAVAARQVPASLGSDTGGSVRQPAALCGVTGLKPTYGRISRYGLVAFASSLDQIGTFTRSAADAAELLGVLAGHDPRDSTSLPHPVPDYRAALSPASGGLDGLRIGVVREAFTPQVEPATLQCATDALRSFEKLGAKTVEVSLPHASYGVAAYYLLATAEASSNLARYDGVKYGLRVASDDLGDMYRRTRSRGFGDEVKRRIMLGTFVLSAGYYDAYYRKAQQVRTLIRRDFAAALESCDVLAMPTTPGPAWLLGERVEDPLAMYLADVFTVLASLAGLPALSLPCGFVQDNLPVGVQLIGRPLDEATPLRAAHVYQQHTDWHRAAPTL
jgi:aspartyl-tRNA(Asn)/glutamyl-tRNA(Gln) amidotransferase subunit A